MILILGMPDDPSVARVLEVARARHIECVILNDAVPWQMESAFEMWGGPYKGYLYSGDLKWNFDDFSGIYTISMNVVDRSTGIKFLERRELIHAVMHDWLEETPIPVLNRGGTLGYNWSKPYQSQRIMRSGFLVPPTLISNDPSEVLAFHREYGRVVYQTIGVQGAVMREWRGEKLQDLERLRSWPMQFQAWMASPAIRVHVVGSAVFATEIHGDDVEYRTSQVTRMAPMHLPLDVSDKCLDLSAQLGLPLCGIDLKQSKDGDYYCLEVNPSPAYSHFEAATGQPIAAAIVDYLAG
ncbi:MAG: hypothetical protein H7839_15775 [Magnetococcus sp. YQC-5]